MSKKDFILVTGALGQIGSSLIARLRDTHTGARVLATDVRSPGKDDEAEGPFELLDILDKKRLHELVNNYNVTQIYHLAALLSASGEQHPLDAWHLNMEGLLNVLEVAREEQLDRVFWPSSIAVFGEHSPKKDTPQIAAMDPSTIYGISKIAGESWCQYYYQKYGVDVRSVRYPGLIGFDGLPGGGTTDYAVDIFHKAVQGDPFVCFLDRDTRLPMMYMPDGIRAALELMHADAGKLTIRTSYNIAGCSFTPEELAREIQEHIPDFSIRYQPDYRQDIAGSWPSSIDDGVARRDWGWESRYDLSTMTGDMLRHLRKWQGQID